MCTNWLSANYSRKGSLKQTASQILRQAFVVMNTDSPKMRNVTRAVKNFSSQQPHGLSGQHLWRWTLTHLRWGMWWDRFPWEGRVADETHWRQTPPQRLSDLPAAGRAGTAWLWAHPETSDKHANIPQWLQFLCHHIAGWFFYPLGFQGKGSTYDLTLVSRNCRKVQPFLKKFFLPPIQSSFGKTCMQFLFPDLFSCA